MQRVLVSCAIAALAACTSFTSTSSPDTTSDGGTSPDASTPSATCSAPHESCEDFEEATPPGNGWTASSAGPTYGSDGAYAGKSMSITEGAFPGTFLVHAFAAGAKHVVCGAEVWLGSPAAQDVELIRFSDGSRSIDIVAGQTGHVNVSSYDPDTSLGDGTDSMVDIPLGTWTPIVLEAQLQAKQVTVSIKGVPTTAALPFGMQQIATVSVGLYATNSPSLPWSAKFDEIWCDVK